MACKGEDTDECQNIVAGFLGTDKKNLQVMCRDENGVLILEPETESFGTCRNFT